MQRIDDDWLRAEATQRVFAVLAAGGHRALAVGGCVRDALMGRMVRDVDLATDARPERATALLEAAGLRVVPTGIAHGTVTVVSGGVPHEVTTFRRDVATDGRRAVVAFSDRVEEDAGRRDFTMNALYAGADGAVVDPLGGLPDLRARRVRFIGAAERRIREDYLRILRFFRFTAWHGDPALGLDAEGLAASAALQGGLDRLSRERVGHEMRRLLEAPDPAPAVAAMARTGILARVLPGAEAGALAPLVHGEGGRAPDWLRRLAALGGDAGGLRLSRAEARTLEALRGAEGGPFALGAGLGAARAADVLLLRAASGAPVPPGAWAEAERGAGATFPLAAADLMPPLAGPALGEALARARAAWAGSGGRLGRDALREVALRDAAGPG